MRPCSLVAQGSSRARAAVRCLHPERALFSAAGSKVLMCAGIPELVKLLQRQSKAVFLVSGGFHAIIDPIAEHLAIPASHVFANTILYKVQVATFPAAMLSLAGRRTWDHVRQRVHRLQGCP